MTPNIQPPTLNLQPLTPAGAGLGVDHGLQLCAIRRVHAGTHGLAHRGHHGRHPGNAAGVSTTQRCCHVSHHSKHDDNYVIISQQQQTSHVYLRKRWRSRILLRADVQTVRGNPAVRVPDGAARGCQPICGLQAWQHRRGGTQVQGRHLDVSLRLRQPGEVGTEMSVI